MKTAFRTTYNPAINRIELKDAFNELIRLLGPYDIFIHVTFREETWEYLALRRFKHFLKHLNTTKFRFYAKYIKTFLVVEYNPSRDGVHIHAFIRGIPAKYATLLQAAADTYFGVSKVTPYDPDLGGTHYLSWKYSDNYKIAEYGLYKINSRLR